MYSKKGMFGTPKRTNVNQARAAPKPNPLASKGKMAIGVGIAAAAIAGIAYGVYKAKAPSSSTSGPNGSGPNSSPCSSSNPSGTCPSPQTCGGGGTPGVCGQFTLVFPKSFNGPSVIQVGQNICQPIEFTGFGYNCCGTPIVSPSGANFFIQLIGSDGKPMAGATIVGAASGIYASMIALDKPSYITDSQGRITVNMSLIAPAPTSCSSGSQTGNTPSAVFYMAGYASYASITVDFPITYYTTTHTNGGFCGSCP